MEPRASLGNKFVLSATSRSSIAETARCLQPSKPVSFSVAGLNALFSFFRASLRILALELSPVGMLCILCYLPFRYGRRHTILPWGDTSLPLTAADEVPRVIKTCLSFQFIAMQSSRIDALGAIRLTIPLSLKHAEIVVDTSFASVEISFFTG